MAVSAATSAATGIDVAYVPLSPRGTDMMDEVSEEIVLALRPVIVGPVPESLVAAVFLPYRLEAVVGSARNEANLARLSGIRAEIPSYSVDEPTRVRVDLADMEAPPELALSEGQVVQATLAALRYTLRCARSATNGRYLFDIVHGEGKTEPPSWSEELDVDIADRPVESRGCPALLGLPGATFSGSDGARGHPRPIAIHQLRGLSTSGTVAGMRRLDLVVDLSHQ